MKIAMNNVQDISKAITERAEEIISTVERTLNRELSEEEKESIFKQVEKEFTAQEDDWMLIKDPNEFKKEADKAKELVSNAIKEMIYSDSTIQFFGEFALLTRFIPTNDKEFWLGAITVTKRGPLCYYNPVNIQKLTKGQLRFLLIHEFLHVLYRHHARESRFSYDHKLANYAQDVVINTRLLSGEFRDVEFIEGGVQLPEKCKNIPLVFEAIYKELDKEKLSAEELVKLLGSKMKSNSGGEGNGEPLQGGVNEKGESLDNHGQIPRDIFGNNVGGTNGGNETEGIGGEGSIGIEQYNNIVSSMLDKIKNRLISKSKGRGLSSGLEQLLDEFEIKPKRKWTSPVIREIRSWIGTKSKTYSRPNRRNIKGLKGKFKVSSTVNILLDTSGSMFSPEDMQKVFSVFSFDSCIVNLVQIDTIVRDFKKIEGKKLKHVPIKGGGGTILQPALNLLIAKKLTQHPTLILTDGYTDSLDLSEFNRVVAITCQENLPISKMPKVSYKLFTNKNL